MKTTKMNNNLKKKLLNVLSTLVIVLLAVVALFVVVSRIQNRVLFVFGRATVWVVTDSMEDTIPAQSYILIEKVTDAENQVTVGDIITFYSEDTAIKGKLNTHEVIRVDKENGWFITKGKNNVAEDTAPVPFANVVGKYVRNLPALTVVGRFLMSVPGFTIVSLALFAMICAVYIPEIVKAVKKEKDPEKGNDDEHEKELQRLIAEEVERLKQQQSAPDEKLSTVQEVSTPDNQSLPKQENSQPKTQLAENQKDFHPKK